MNRQRELEVQEPGLIRSVPPRLAPVVHRDLPRAAASASEWALRGARVPPVDHRHKPLPPGSLLDADPGCPFCVPIDTPEEEAAATAQDRMGGYGWQVVLIE